MKKLIRFCAAFVIALLVTLLVNAQNVPIRQVSKQAEFECIRLLSSNKVVPPGQPDLYVTYHHVWTPDLKSYPFASGGLNLAFNTEGVGKELVIVVAGGPGMPREYFQPAMSPLSRYATLVYYDRRADVLSHRPPHDYVTISELADDLDTLRRTIGYRRVTLLAHSFGSAIALNYALRYPENVKRLILVGASAFIEDPRQTEQRLTSSLTPEEAAALNRSEAQASGATMSCNTLLNRYRIFFPHYFNKPLEQNLSEANLYAAYIDALARKLSFVTSEGQFDVRSRLSEIKVPTLILAGKYDLVTPFDQVQELARGIRSSRLAVMNHSGHFPFFEENFLFTEWVRQFIVGTADLQDDLDIPQQIASPGAGTTYSPMRLDYRPGASATTSRNN